MLTTCEPRLPPHPQQLLALCSLPGYRETWGAQLCGVLGKPGPADFEGELERTARESNIETQLENVMGPIELLQYGTRFFIFLAMEASSFLLKEP